MDEGFDLRCKPGQLMVDNSDGKRGIVSKVIQTTFADAVVRLRYPGENVSYETGRTGAVGPISNVETVGSRSGEYIYKDGKPLKPFDGVNNEDLANLLTKVSGDKFASIKLSNGDDLSKPAGLSAAIEAFKKSAADHGTPFIASINEIENASGSRLGHDIVVTRLDAGPPERVYYKNSADEINHDYPDGQPQLLSDFVRSMGEVKDVNGKTVGWQPASGVFKK